ncbi:MAG: hypothetical protein ACOX7A_05165 [Lawsonibacter sp.]|jgi:hypothetical protein
MASNHTTNYQLCQWQADDQVKRTDFNEDNAKIDNALKGLSDGLAAEVAERQSVINTLNTAVEQCGNCRITYGTYIGTGGSGAAAPNRLVFPFEPKVVIVQKLNGSGTDGSGSKEFGKLMMILVRPISCYFHSNGVYTNAIIWSGNSLQWHGFNAQLQHNTQGETYLYMALG